MEDSKVVLKDGLLLSIPKDVEYELDIIHIAGIYDDCINTTTNNAPVMYSPQVIEEIA